MKKLTLFFFALLALGLGFQACDNTKTYAEMLEDEKDAIKAFIKDSSINVISQSEFYAQDSMTDVSKNQYVQLASGVYMQIVDKGSTNPADTVKSNDEVLVRFSEYNIMEKFFTYDSFGIATAVDLFRYVVTPSSIAGTFIEGYYMYNTGSRQTVVPSGWLVALSYVRNKSHVKLIIPAKMGSTSSMQSVTPYYYDLKFKIYD